MVKYIILLFLAFTIFSTVFSQEKDIVTEEVEYNAGDETMKGFIAYDKNIEGKRPGVIVVHEWWGHNEYARKRAEMLAELGYTGFAIDMYGDGKTASHPDDAGKFASEVMKNIQTGEKRFLAAMEFLKSHQTVDPENISAIGYCFGGGVVLHMARIGIPLKGVVSFHGGLSDQQVAKEGEVKAKILVCHGADDQMITQDQIEAFKNEMENAGVDYKLISYPGAKHSFTNPAADELGKKFNIPVAYNEKADKESWQAMKEFLESVFNN
ncbi:MAG: dienelactone hydrolase family protein [Ignavibacteriaceae bacterium]